MPCGEATATTGCVVVVVQDTTRQSGSAAKGRARMSGVWGFTLAVPSTARRTLCYASPALVMWRSKPVRRWSSAATIEDGLFGRCNGADVHGGSGVAVPAVGDAPVESKTQSGAV